MPSSHLILCHPLLLLPPVPPSIRESIKADLCFLAMTYENLPSLVAQTVKRLPAMQVTWVRSLGWEDPLEKEMATYSSILAWKIPWTEEPDRLQSMRSQRVAQDWATSLSFTFYENLVPWPGVEPRPQQWKPQVLTARLPEISPKQTFLSIQK